MLAIVAVVDLSIRWGGRRDLSDGRLVVAPVAAVVPLLLMPLSVETTV